VLEQVRVRFGWLLHAYCLMGDHYHLMVETPDTNLSAGMRHLNGVYNVLTGGTDESTRLQGSREFSGSDSTAGAATWP
jgi:REP element-mobilizing transposase RayT